MQKAGRGRVAEAWRLSPPTTRSDVSVHRILVVDDEPDIRRLVKEALSVSGYQVETAADGDEAVRKGSLTLPDLVLLDIMMPKEDGFAVYERLRAKPAALVCPIIFLTARREIDDKLAGFRQGAVDYITKPFHIKELVARVKVHLDEPGPSKGEVPSPLTGAGTRDRTLAVRRQDVQAGGPRPGLSRRAPCATTCTTSIRS